MISPAEASDQLHRVIEEIEVAVTRGLKDLETEVRRQPLVAALESLRSAAGLVDASTERVIELSAVWFPSPADTPKTTSVVLSRISAASALYASGVARLRDLDVPSVVTGLARIEADPRVQTFDQAVTAALAGTPLTEPGAPLDTAKVGATFRGYFSRDTLLDGLVTTAATAVRDEARQVATSERAGPAETTGERLAATSDKHGSTAKIPDQP